MLTYLNAKNDLYAMIGVKGDTVRSDIKAAVYSALRRTQEFFSLYGDWSFEEQLTDTVYIPLAAPYTTGTVTTTLDSKTITGSGTTWTKDMEGSFFQVGTSEAYEIRSFVSTTSLTLAIPYQITGDTGLSYTIRKRFYNLPLNFVKALALDAKISTPGYDDEDVLAYNDDASFVDKPTTSGKPQWFGIAGNSHRSDYFNTGTVTVATTTGTSTWTISSGTLPTDIVDREVRIVGDSRGYAIDARTGNTTFTTYNTYVNPSDATNIATAASYAITPKQTKLVGFSDIPDQRYVFSLPYIKSLEENISDSDISPIVSAGYEHAYICTARKILAEDARVAVKGDTVKSLQASFNEAISEAWGEECRKTSDNRQASFKKPQRMKQGPSWLSR